MTFQVTAARSSRVTNSRRPNPASALGLRRSTSSPSKASPRKRASVSEAPTSEQYGEPLDDTGVIASLAGDLQFRDVPQYMQHIRNNMFSAIPEKGAGMNSTRIADILNHRNSIPPIVSIAHIDALGSSSTRIEREIQELARAGILRRVTIPQRGVGAAAVGDGVVLVSEWQDRVNSSIHLSTELKEKYLSFLAANPTSMTVPGSSFTPEELRTLTSSGFLSTPFTTLSSSLLSLSTSSSLVTSSSRQPSGSLGAVGFATAPNIKPSSLGRSATETHYSFSLPNGGAYIKLLVDARAHLVSLLKKGSKHKEAPLDVLREKWDGGISASIERTETKRARGEVTGVVLPGRTRKWKKFWGLMFEWVLEECVGAGLVECFETGSVGVGVRVV